MARPEQTDASLLEHLRSAEGEAFEAAFGAVYAAEKGVVYGLLLRLTGDASAAADLFQNVWLKLARHRRELRADTVLRAWLCTVARREYLNHRRAQALDLSRVLTLGLEPAAEVTASDTRLLELNAALRQLSDADREVLFADERRWPLLQPSCHRARRERAGVAATALPRAAPAGHRPRGGRVDARALLAALQEGIAMSPALEQLLRASLRTQPPEELEQLVLGRALQVAQQAAAAAAARTRRTRAARSLWLSLRGKCLQVARLGLAWLGLFEPPVPTGRADTV